MTQAAVTDDPVRLFEHLSDDCHPISTKERRYSNDNKEFISMEEKGLFDEGLIKVVNSPWHNWREP